MQVSHDRMRFAFLLSILHCIIDLPSLSTACPARVLIKPCTCNEITKGLEIVCEGVRLDNLRNVFENLHKSPQTIMYLKMKNNHLNQFPADLLGQLDVRHLMAHKCAMSQVEPNALHYLRDKIESIDFSENKFTQIPSALTGLQSLVSLNLNFNEIETIHEKAFDGLVSLLRLSLFGNNIVTIHPQAFVGVGVNLTRINLGGNRLESVPTEALSHLKSIQRVQIHENHIHSLAREDFANMQGSDKFDFLNLARNSLKKLQANVFYDLRTLNSLDLDSNKIIVIDDEAFDGIQDTLEWLKLGDNQLKSIPTGALQNLTKLRELDLRGNQIRTVFGNSFDNFGHNLKFLYLQKNKIMTIEPTAFDQLHSLEWLYLNSNQLKQIPEQTFFSLTKTLMILDLHDNPLVCKCDLLWYQQWIGDNSKNQMAKVWKETRCKMSADALPTNDNRFVKEYLLEEVNDQLKCASISKGCQLVLFSILFIFLI